MRKRSGQVHSRESSATLQLTVSLLYQPRAILVEDKLSICYTMEKKFRKIILRDYFELEGGVDHDKSSE